MGLGFALLAPLALGGGGAAQQGEPLDPAVVVGLVQSFYDQTKTLQAEFEQTRYTRLLRSLRPVPKGRSFSRNPG